MKTRAYGFLVSLLCAVLSGCAGGNGGSNPEKPQPTVDTCPVSRLSQEQIQSLIAYVTDDNPPSSEITSLGNMSIDRAGRLVFGLARAGLEDSEILNLIQSGRFEILMSWLQDKPENVDLFHFSRCEEN